MASVSLCGRIRGPTRAPQSAAGSCPAIAASAPAHGACDALYLCMQEKELGRRALGDANDELPGPHPSDATAAAALHAQRQAEHVKVNNKGRNVLRVAEELVILNLSEHIRNAMNKGDTQIRHRRSKAKRTACDLRRVPAEACTTCVPRQSIRQRLMHARCVLRMQRAEFERRKRVMAEPHQLGTPRSSAAPDGPLDHASRDTQHQTGSRSRQPRMTWTPKLNQRFVEAVGQLGIKTARPKTIMQVVPLPFLLSSLSSLYTQQHFTCPLTK